MNIRDLDRPESARDFGDGPPYPESRTAADTASDAEELADELSTVFQRFTGELTRPEIVGTMIDFIDIVCELEGVDQRIAVLHPDETGDGTAGIAVETSGGPENAPEVLSGLNLSDHPADSRAVPVEHIGALIRSADESGNLVPADEWADSGDRDAGDGDT